MRLSVSNIAWDPEENEDILKYLLNKGIKLIEVAPTKIWSKPLEQRSETLNAFRTDLLSQGIEVAAFQSILYGQGHLQLFESQELMRQMKLYLYRIICLAEKLGVRSIVFGSPKNRRIGSLPLNEAMDIALEFFHDIGNHAYKHGVIVCIEPNPSQYGCNFLTDSLQVVKFLKLLNHSALKMNVDTGEMILNEQDICTVLEECSHYIGHFHISEPFLQMIGKNEQKHREIAKGLEQIHYKGILSIEMRSGLSCSNLSSVRQALFFVLKTYNQVLRQGE